MSIKRLSIVLKKLPSNVKTNPKSFYAYVRSKSQTKTSVGFLKNGDGVLIANDLQMSEVLKQLFWFSFYQRKCK